MGNKAVNISGYHNIQCDINDFGGYNNNPKYNSLVYESKHIDSAI
jgi:hypothetical protein